MFPTLWIIDTYTVCMAFGIVCALLVFNFYAKKIGMNKGYKLSILINACLSVVSGIVFSILFQMLFDAIKGVPLTFAMTFFGGLVGGAGFFILYYFLKIKKEYKDEKFLDILIIAPACITIAHAFGRIGCFMAGCCYGIETDSIFGVKFPFLDHKVYPTQLFESAFLFALFIPLFILAIKKKFIYTMPIYMVGYGIFRFLNEFLRGDERGALLPFLTPSQGFSVLALIGGIILFIYLFRKNNQKISGESE